MTDIQAHRGPDGEGVWASHDGGCVLGHRRLAIIDLSPGGAQPKTDPEIGTAITFNGEIYNYLELRDELCALGHRFHSQSDTEVLLRSYAEWGHECLSRLNGMFAFALWDPRKRELFCARDRFGEKPLNFAFTHEAFAFASEVKALFLVEGVDRTIDVGVLGAYIERGSTAIDATERTLIRGIKQLLPGHAMLVRQSDIGVEHVRTWSYFDVAIDGRHPYGLDDLEESALQLRELLRQSVRLRLRSDVPVGSCLSGGLDSSAVVSLMRELEPDMAVRTFTGRFPGDPMDEGRYASLVVREKRTIHFETEPTPERFMRDGAKVYWHAEFPIGGMSQFAQYCVFGLARENGVTVLLDGQGSDEQLGGYGNSITMAFLRQIMREHRPIAFERERRRAAVGNPRLFRWSKLLLHETPFRAAAPLLRRATKRSIAQRSDYFRAEFLDEAFAAMPCAPFPAAEEGASLSKTLWTLSFRTMLSSLLRFGDRLSMAHSREVRLPFCDYRITQFAFGLSPDLLVGDGQVKRVLRKAIDGLVPDEIVTRPKQGFVPPQTRWLIGPLEQWTRQLADDTTPLDDLMDMSAVCSLATSSSEVRLRDVAVLWDVVNMRAWARDAYSEMCKLPAQPLR